MNLTMYQIDAFTRELFHGNPAAVCPLDTWLPDDVMQAIAEENNLAETAFYVREEGGFHIRWFTTVCEVDLCGHATLATAHALFHHEGYIGESLTFSSRSGVLRVRRDGDLLVLDFPVDTIRPAEVPEGLMRALGGPPRELFRGKDDLLVVYDREAEIRAIEPDFAMIGKVPCRGVIVTAPGETVDFVSRFFGPQSGIPEDPVTGSAHTTLVPYWAERLKKTTFTALQLSRRGGTLRCALKGDRVEIAGHAVTYLEGTIRVPGV
ncbi:MAG: PhzF family phenazine biosynthesis protein [Ignavibacteriae bacterium]|nr:PhzF family phenazine biosynthesis protein [Ignavibacteriota bacterium]